jgi:chorismate synthase
MSSSWGRQVVYSLFGESHGSGVGITIHHLPAGFQPDFIRIRKELLRRKPGSGIHATTRQESDDYEILSGVHNEKLTGAPLTVFFWNTDTRSKDYQSLSVTPRPSHADYAAMMKYGGHQDPRGGGHFSGRLTAPIVFAGALINQLLEREGVLIGSRIFRMGSVKDHPEVLEESSVVRICSGELKGLPVPFLSDESIAEAFVLLEQLRSGGDSVGGQIEVCITGVPPGWGEPFFDSLESSIAHLVFSIPGIKALEFGAGTEFSGMKGSQANDPWTTEGDQIRTKRNNSGGINGGISNGMPVRFKVTFRPTPSISMPQDTVNLTTGSDTVLEIHGRHDPCIVPRACPVVEAIAAMALMEAMLDQQIQTKEGWR